MPRYQKPKTLLVDSDLTVKRALQEMGLNVREGTFGQPYRVEPSNDFYPVVGNFSLPNASEQELVIIDLAIPEIIDHGYDPQSSLPEEGPCAKGSWGAIDPRPLAAIRIADTFGRIRGIGGVFVVFAAASIPQEFRMAQRNQYGNPDLSQLLDCTIWSFLSELERIPINTESGEEMFPQGDSSLADLLSNFLSGSTYECTFPYPERFLAEHEVLAVNKYEDAVALIARGIHGSNVSADTKGTFIVVPQLNDKAGFLKRLIPEILPSLSPQFFPDFKVDEWIHQRPYQLRKVWEVEEQRNQLIERVKEEIASITTTIEQERERYPWLRELVTGTGDGLVVAVKTALETIGFSKIREVDAERDAQGQARREDLQILDASPTLIVDIKGVNGQPKDSDIQQPSKHALMRIREWNRTDVISLFIVNHERSTPPLQRTERPFREEMIGNAIDSHTVLLTTWDLFRLLLGLIDNAWRSDHVKPLFYQPGLVTPVPIHYSKLGIIIKYFKSALIMRLDGPIKKGDRLGFEYQNRLTEGVVTSLQLNGVNHERAAAGEEVGIQLEPLHPKLKGDLPIYLVANVS